MKKKKFEERMKPNKREWNPTGSPKRKEMELSLADARGLRGIAPKNGNLRFQIETLVLKTSQKQLQALQMVQDPTQSGLWKQVCEEFSRNWGE